MIRLRRQNILKKDGRRHIHVSRSTVSLYDTGTQVVWRACMQFYNLYINLTWLQDNFA